MLAIPQVASNHHGLRPVQARHDLTQIADLIELCFADTLDAGGRSAIQEMRSVATLGPALWFLQSLDRMVKGLVQGFVWEEQGQIIGNVSLYPAAQRGTWALANVAVHPAHRGRGIAQALCRAALQRIMEWDGHGAVLQVDASNDAAKQVYYRLGFYAQRGFTRWHWSFYQRPIIGSQPMPYITYRSWQDGKAAYELAGLVRPNSMGGLGWLRPLKAGDFEGGFWSNVAGLFKPTRQQDFVVRGENHSLEALLMTRSNFGSGTLHFDLMVHPEQYGQLERPMIDYALRCATEQFRNASTEHPTDDRAARAVFEEYGFEARRSLIHMQWDRI